MSAAGPAPDPLLLRAVEALETIAGALVALALPGEPAPCAHPVEDRRDSGSTMGHARWVCTLCGYEVTS